jgi:hypothetical protein
MQNYCGVEIPRVYSLQKIGVTQSKLKGWMECQLSFLFNINRLWKNTGSGGKSNSTGFGTLFHHILEMTYTQWRDKKVLPTPQQTTKWLDKFIAEFPDQCSEWSERDAAVIEVMLPAYLQFYRSDFKTIEILHVEKQLEAELNGCCLRSKIDLIFKNKGYIFSLDHKTKGRIDEDAICKAMSFDFQHQFYTYSIESELGLNVAGSYHNVIRNPGDKLDGDNYEDFKAHLADKVQKNPAHYFKRFLVNFTKEDKAAYTEELVEELQDIKEHLAGKKRFKRNVTSCQGSYGPCAFLDACSSNSLRGYEFGTVFFPELDLPDINNLLEETYYGNGKSNAAGKSQRTRRTKS